MEQSVAVRTLAGLLEQAESNPRRFVKHSSLDYHAPGLDYLCLLRSPDLTVKLYVTDPARCAPGSWLVGPHDHAYDFSTLVLSGCVTNYRLTQAAEGRPGEGLHRFSHRGADRVFVPDGLRDTLVGSGTKHGPGQSYYLEAEDVHTISVSPRENVFALFQHRTRRPVTKFWGPSREAPSLEGLYRPMTEGRAHYMARSALCAIYALDNADYQLLTGRDLER